MKYQGITITKNKTCNTWYARYRHNGKQFYVSAKTQLECYNKLKKELKQVSKLQNKPKNDSIMTLKQWFDKWLDLYKQNVKTKTKEDYFYSMQYLEKLHNISLDKITSLQIIETLNNIKFERRKQIVYELLQTLYTKAINNEIINKNPMLKIEKPKHKKINGSALSNEDELKLEKILIDKKLDIFLICLYQGLRRGEVLAIESTDIDFNKKTLTISKAINEQEEFDTTKNIYSKRTIPLFDKTINILKKYKNTQGRIFNYKYKWCDTTFKNIIEKNFENKNYTMHSLRHTFITKCQENNIPLHIIQKWVGHITGSKVTNEVYTHIREDAENKNYEILNQKLNSNSTH